MPRQKKKKLSLTTSFDELDESLLLGDDTPTPTRSGRASRRRSGPSLDTNEAELLGESPIVIKKSTKRRRKTRSSADNTPSDVTPQVSSSRDVERSHSARPRSRAQSSTDDPLPTSEIIPDDVPIADIVISAVVIADVEPGDVIEGLSPVKPTQVIAPEAAEIIPDTPAVEVEDIHPIPAVDTSSPVPAMSDISLDIRDTIPPIQSEAALTKSAEKAKTPVEVEIDIYGDLSANTTPTTADPGPVTTTTNGTKGKDISFDEVFKMSEPEVKEVKQGSKRVQRYPSEKEEEDLDYEEDTEPQMKIGVLVSKKQVIETTATPDHGHILPALPDPSPAPPAPQQQMIPPMLIPPMLPLPALRPSEHRPALHFPPPHYKPIQAPSFPRNNSKRKIYINPKFKTQVIVSNLERDGVLKGGLATIHVNSRHISPEEKKRARSRSPLCHGVPEYVPSPIRKALDEPTTTLIVTELSACTTRNRLKEMFASIGSLKEVQTYPQERRAVVTFAQAADAVVCRRKFHRSFIDGTYIGVNFAI